MYVMPVSKFMYMYVYNMYVLLIITKTPLSKTFFLLVN